MPGEWKLLLPGQCLQLEGKQQLHGGKPDLPGSCGVASVERLDFENLPDPTERRVIPD